MPISLANGVSASPGYTPTTWPTTADAHGLSTSQAYLQYPTGVSVITRDSIPSFTLNGTQTSATTGVYLKAVNLPANTIGPDGEYEIRIKWSCNSSAITKTLTAMFAYYLYGGANLPWSSAATTQTANELVFYISNRGVSTSQFLSALPGPGQGAFTFPAGTIDFRNDTGIVFNGVLGSGATSADYMRIESITVTAINPQIYASQRLQPGVPQFYGLNGHYDDTLAGTGITGAQVVASMKTAGVKMYRITYENTQTSLNQMVAVAQAFQTDGTGLQMYACIDLDMTSNGTNLWTTEALAYTAGYTAAQTVVNALAPLGVKYFECGNELDSKNGVNTVNSMGASPSDFSMTVWPILRGIVRGGIDGVHAAGQALGKTVYAASNAFVQCGKGASDMLWNGTNPDGSAAPTGAVRWDITAWHNYEDYGSLYCIENNFSGPYLNLIEYISRKYQRPIVISEWNAKSSDTDAARSLWGTRFLTEHYLNRYKYNILGIICYEMFGSPWAVMSNSASPATLVSTFGTTFNSFITANPDTGT